jgi:hypothetical protein
VTIAQVLTDLDASIDGPLSLVVGRTLEQGGDLLRVRLAVMSREVVPPLGGESA